MRTSAFKMLPLVLATALFAGCSSTDTQPMMDDGMNGGAAGTSETTGLGMGGGLSESELAEQQRLAELKAQEAEAGALREVRTFYFEFDQTVLRPEAQTPLRAHAAFLAANPSAQVVLNGYADERGTKEYNLALGERRAKAVERFLVVNGAGEGQLEVVSFGEEFPVDYGHDEGAWSKNRRVVLEYK
ncbi:MAG: peptidoglycan-associated lipoprotein Pal [Hahellaceae bacterium]|jgi:peptidoglycan-associated lipoprotein|nr:peptidoglycan-associated lipoprotein Pal [Hahellaceae bacterium]